MKSVSKIFPRPANDTGIRKVSVTYAAAPALIAPTKSSSLFHHPLGFGLIFLCGIAAGLIVALTVTWMQHVAYLADEKPQVAPKVTVAAETPQPSVPSTPVAMASLSQPNITLSAPPPVEVGDPEIIKTNVSAYSIVLPADDSDMPDGVAATLKHATRGGQDNHVDARLPVDQAMDLSRATSSGARAELEKLVWQNPNNAMIEGALAHYLLRQNDMKGAADHTVQAIRLDPENLSYRLDLARIYDQEGRAADALNIYRRLLGSDADDADDDNALPLRAIRARAQYLSTIVDGE